ncbi:MAG: DNA polymerase IV [Alphaproteobacteria bacterium]|nr:DNA polymerase IV [Alphaproteobacteria bacterium]
MKQKQWQTGPQSDLKIAHFDCDCFFAAVEKRDNPHLHDKPIAVGSDTPRSVVATACYVARIYGVRSAMPMVKAKILCPQLVIVPHNFSKYKQAHQAIKQILLTADLPLKYDMLDEGDMDISQYQGDKIALFRGLQQQIRETLQLTLSFGLGPNKVMAKIICNIEKPNGLVAMNTNEIKQWMKDKSVSLLPGVGPATANRLAKRGITRISQLQTADETMLMQQFGKFGASLKAMSLAQMNLVGSSAMNMQSRVEKTISLEHTFRVDVNNIKQLEACITQFSHDLARKLHGRACIKVVLKLRNHHFETSTRNITLAEPIWQAEQIAETGIALLKNMIQGRHYYHVGSDSQTNQQSYRLIGLGIGSFVKHRGSFALFDADNG